MILSFFNIIQDGNMNFISIGYLLFFATVLVLYYSICKKYQWQLLLIASVVFYAFSSLAFLGVLIYVISITYCTGILLDKINNKSFDRDKKEVAKYSKLIIVASVCLMLASLGIFKYNKYIFPSTSLFTQIGLPLGMSFYIFVSLGYCIDVYRKVVPAEKNPFKCALFVSFFPHLIEGPISSYKELSVQFTVQHEYIEENCKLGLERIIWGVFKKLVIANQLVGIIGKVLDNYQYAYGIEILFGVILYSIWLYSDFSGFIDIAIGSAQALGIQVSENFNTPFLSKSLAEYWRRWHMTLGAWFQNYLFYPLQKSKLLSTLRKRLKKSGHKHASTTVVTVIALFITWTLIGIWHGAEISYLFYGIYNALIMIISFVFEKYFRKIDERILLPVRFKNVIRIVRTYILVLWSFLIFWPENINITLTMVRHIFQSSFINRHFFVLIYENIREFAIAIPATIVLIAVDFYHFRAESAQKLSSGGIRNKINSLPRTKRLLIWSVAIVIILVFGSYGYGINNEFAYFRF